MEQIISDYLFLIYAIPTVSILWAANDIKSFISVVQVGAVLFLFYGCYEAFDIVDKASRYVSDDDKMKMFFVTLSPFFILSTGALLNMVCLNAVLEQAVESSTSIRKS